MKIDVKRPTRSANPARAIIAISLLTAATVMGNPFFAFDNGLGRKSPAEQAALLKELGYDGIGYTGTGDFAVRKKAFDEQGLKIFNLYVHSFVDNPDAYEAGLKEAIPSLTGSGVDLWLTLRGKAPDDTAAVRVVREIADQAAAAGLRVALYPHKDFFVETAEQALRIVKQVDRPNVGLTLNLCHELAAGNADRLHEIVKACSPHLFYVSINGADRSGGWPELIRPLDEGKFDVPGLLKSLGAAGYKGPVGLQCFQVPGAPEEHLQRSITKWKEIRGSLLTGMSCLAAAVNHAADAAKPRVLILSGANNHDWQQTTPAIKTALEASGKFLVDVEENVGTMKPDAFAPYAVVLSNYNTFGKDAPKGEWSAETKQAFLDHVAKGRGLVIVHAGSSVFYDWPEFQALACGTWKDGTGHGAIHVNRVAFTGAESAITRGLAPFWIRDEFWQNIAVAPGAKALASVTPDPAFKGSGKPENILFTTETGGGRGFALFLGHDATTMKNTAWITLLQRGTEWAATGKVTIPPASDWPATRQDAERMTRSQKINPTQTPS
jgi:sugar phosphate isomerase/epimerase/type 1 glutamine amidotransferase